MTAPQCAGIIHTDFERGFIRAEVTSYDDYVEHRTSCTPAVKYVDKPNKSYVVLISTSSPGSSMPKSSKR
jgi:ribosome-binding ATPase YchF (GTP1/OBG family)